MTKEFDKEMDELKRLAKIGKKIEMAFEKGYILTQSVGKHAEMYDIDSIEQMLKEIK